MPVKRTDTEKLTLKNELCEVEYDPSDKTISGRSLTDPNNLLAFYSKSKRGIIKSMNLLEESFTDDTTMYGAIHILAAAGIRCRSYCTMD